jgi:hypothetical protein
MPSHAKASRPDFLDVQGWGVQEVHVRTWITPSLAPVIRFSRQEESDGAKPEMQKVG